MCVSMSMRAAEYGIRVPDSILAAYAPFNVQWVPSPSRLLSLMDPLLPTGVLAGCLAAYSGMGKSPFDDCTTNSIKSLTGKTSQPMNVIERRKKTNSLLRLLGVGSKESKLRSSTYLEASPESFYSCVSSPQSVPGNSVPTLNTSAVVGNHSPRHMLHCNGIVYCQENNFHQNEVQKLGEHGSENSLSDREKEYESDCTASEHSQHPQSRRHSEDSIPSRPLSPQKSKHGRGDEAEHIAVHYHSDTEECHVVNVVETRPGSPDGELLLFPLEAPYDGPYLEAGTPLAEDEEPEQDEEPHERTTSMSQVCLPIAKNPYMSPLLAPDEMLKSLPPIDLVVSELTFRIISMILLKPSL